MLLLTDKTMKEIANDMYLVKQTVDTIQTRIFKKVEVQSRVGLILRYYKDESYAAKLNELMEKNS